MPGTDCLCMHEISPSFGGTSSKYTIREDEQICSCTLCNSLQRWYSSVYFCKTVVHIIALPLVEIELKPKQLQTIRMSSLEGCIYNYFYQLGLTSLLVSKCWPFCLITNCTRLSAALLTSNTYVASVKQTCVDTGSILGSWFV